MEDGMGCRSAGETRKVRLQSVFYGGLRELGRVLANRSVGVSAIREKGRLLAIARICSDLLAFRGGFPAKHAEGKQTLPRKGTKGAKTRSPFAFVRLRSPFYGGRVGEGIGEPECRGVGDTRKRPSGRLCSPSSAFLRGGWSGHRPDAAAKNGKHRTANIERPSRQSSNALASGRNKLERTHGRVAQNHKQKGRALSIRHCNQKLDKTGVWHCCGSPTPRAGDFALTFAATGGMDGGSGRDLHLLNKYGGDGS
jgi:hypothetical protein